MATHNGEQYPQVPGSKLEVLTMVDGPSSYTQITPGTPPTGGQTLNAKDVGLGTIDFVFPGTSDNGTYIVYPIWTTQSAGVKPGQATSVQLMWITAATGAQVSGATNLSGRSVKLFIRGTF
jgi:hypothetical protein